MTPENLKTYKNRLLTLRARLRGDVSDMTSAALPASSAPGTDARGRMPIHMAEVAGDYYDRELTLRLLTTKHDTLQQIERALERMEDGRYGVCDECGRKIRRGRLNALPYTTVCVKCASQSDVF